MLKRLDQFRCVIPKSYKKGMLVEGMVYADEHLLAQIVRDKTLDQVANVATLPGLAGRSLAMPDAHQGYGFCIGGVAASDVREGVVSAGGVGFDINCGVRLLVSHFTRGEIVPHLENLLRELVRTIPCGAGKKSDLRISGGELDEILENGARWAAARGFSLTEDLSRIEDEGRIPGADPSRVSPRAKERGFHQLGTLGSGNHFLEIQFVDTIFDAPTAAAFGLAADRVVILIHSGSRGLGHQVCTDYLDEMLAAMPGYGISVADRQLACVPVKSREGKAYLGAMAAAANFAFANRQMMTHRTREAFARVAGNGDLEILYDVCHNIAKFEEHVVDGSRREVLVHRKGATRAFPPGHAAISEKFRSTGQPVLIPGSMGTWSWVLAGRERAMNETFGSCCHGAGRARSRTQAKRETSAEELLKQLHNDGILVRGESRAGLVEEKPDAYKDVNEVVDVVHGAGLAAKVARLRPLAVMKG